MMKNIILVQRAGTLSALATSLMLGGCMSFIPAYERPAAPVPAAYAPELTPAGATGTTAAADIDPEHQRTLAQGLVGLAEGVSRYLVERGDTFDPEVLGQQVADMAWAGLRAVHRKD